MSPGPWCWRRNCRGCSRGDSGSAFDLWMLERLDAGAFRVVGGRGRFLRSAMLAVSFSNMHSSPKCMPLILSGAKGDGRCGLGIGPFSVVNCVCHQMHWFSCS